MSKNLKPLIAGSVLVLASGSALADDGGGIGFSIAVPGISPYVVPAPGYDYYYSPRAYDAPPPETYNAAPGPIYYDAPPAVSIYYGTSEDGYRARRRDGSDEEQGGHRDWRRHGDDEE